MDKSFKTQHTFSLTNKMGEHVILHAHYDSSRQTILQIKSRLTNSTSLVDNPNRMSQLLAAVNSF